MLHSCVTRHHSMIIHHCMINIKHSYHQNIHPCILLAYYITSYGVYQSFISSKHVHPCILLAYRVTSHLSMHHNSGIAQICITLVVLILHLVMSCTCCIIHMHFTHNHLCIVIGFPHQFTQAQGSLTRNISGIFIPLHISSSGLFNPQHIWDLYPTAYFKLRVPQPATYLESLSHCIFSSQGSLTRNISGIFIPLHMSSSGFFNPQHILGSLSHYMSHHKVLQPTTFMGSLSHCISYHRVL